MSTTLKALNRLEQQRVDRLATSISKTPSSRKINQTSFLLKCWHDRPFVVFIAVCPVFILLGALLGVALNTTLEPSGAAFGDQAVPTSTRYPIPRPSVTSEANHSTDSGLQFISNRNGTVTGNENDNHYATSFRETQEKITQWHGDGLTLQAIVWSMNPAARKAFINSQFVSQGQTVDDYIVAAISEKSVVVSDGQQLWQVVLGR